MADSRVTRQGVEVLYELPTAPESRITRQGIEVLYELTPVGPVIPPRRTIVTITYGPL